MCVRVRARRPIQAVRFSCRCRTDGFQTSFEFLLCCDLEEDHKIAAETPQRQFINIWSNIWASAAWFEGRIGLELNATFDLCTAYIIPSEITSDWVSYNFDAGDILWEHKWTKRGKEFHRSHGKRRRPSSLWQRNLAGEVFAPSIECRDLPRENLILNCSLWPLKLAQ